MPAATTGTPALTHAPSDEAFDAGRRAGLAVAALAVSVASFVSLLGAEKAILAVVLGSAARRGARAGTSARRLGGLAVGIASAFLVSAAVVLVVFWDQVREFVALLQRIS